MKNESRLIAFYLPQFHPIPENNEWWGEGFTEWTNVGKAKPLFKGHDQPKIPSSLGYYDLRLPESREAQANLAREYGIDGFCYWHYWFGKGKRLLERPFNEVLSTGKPDFPFCLGWANHSWKAKTWSIEKGKDKLLIQQEYHGIEDYTNHFYDVLPAFIDKRYIRINNKPLFLIWDPRDIPDASLFIEHWNKLATENGLDGIHFVAWSFEKKDVNHFINLGFNSVSLDYIKGVFNNRSFLNKILSKTLKVLKGTPSYIEYKEYMEYVLKNLIIDDRIFPSIAPNFDHSPRSGKLGAILVNDSPKLFEKFLKLIFDKLSEKNQETNIVFLKSWNEWGEGNYLEPDLKNGKGFLEAIKKSKQNYS